MDATGCQDLLVLDDTRYLACFEGLTLLDSFLYITKVFSVSHSVACNHLLRFHSSSPVALSLGCVVEQSHCSVKFCRHNNLWNGTH